MTINDMSTNLISAGQPAQEKVNLRTPGHVMAAGATTGRIAHRSDIVEKVRRGRWNDFLLATPQCDWQTVWLFVMGRARHRSRLRRAQVFKDRRFLLLEKFFIP